MEVWEKVLIQGAGAEAFFASKHGQAACIDCHQGQEGMLSKEEAHQGLIARPSEDPDTACRGCHFKATRDHKASLHKNLWGEKNLLAERVGVSSFDDLPQAMKDGYGRNCAGCHASCGDCHVSRPASVGGGLVNGHDFGVPDMTQNCTACHGSRVGMEYRGENEGIGADVHYLPNAMTCVDCHSAAEMHGDGSVSDDRLEAPGTAACEDCHGNVALANDYHQEHWGELSCQTCHSQDYKSCNSCHAGEGLAEPSYMSFKIGRNPVSDKRSYDYVTLRHIPIAPDTYKNWGMADLPNFSAAPTWKYSAPHNIRRWTERTHPPEGGTCSTACHETPDGTEGLFLRQADLDAMSPDEAQANQDLIVPDGSPVDW